MFNHLCIVRLDLLGKRCGSDRQRNRGKEIYEELISNKDIENKLDRLLGEKFGCDADKIEMMKKYRFLSSEIGFSAANLLELFLEIEKKFSVSFSKDEILSTQFDDYAEVVEIINKKLGGE